MLPTFQPGKKEVERSLLNAEYLVATKLSDFLNILGIFRDFSHITLSIESLIPAPKLKKKLTQSLSSYGFKWKLELKEDGRGFLRIEPAKRLISGNIPTINLVLFILTCISVSSVGFWFTADSGYGNGLFDFIFSYLKTWLPFSASLIFILLIHEMGHFIAARRWGVLVSWPYFIPFPTLFGTLGAIIKTSSPIPEKKALFDIGAAGPLAGFIASTVIIWAGMFFYTPQAGQITQSGGDALVFGSSILFSAWEHLFFHWNDVNTTSFFNPMIYAGWTGYFLTMFNLLPIGQLDGGHVAYAMFSNGQKILGAGIFTILTSMGFLSLIQSSGMIVWDSPFPTFWPGWLLFSFFLLVVIKISHPPTIPIIRNKIIISITITVFIEMSDIVLPSLGFVFFL